MKWLCIESPEHLGDCATDSQGLGLVRQRGRRAFELIGDRRHEALIEALSDFIERGRLNTTRFSGFLRKN